MPLEGILNGLLQQEGCQIAHRATLPEADLSKVLVDRLGHGNGDSLWLAISLELAFITWRSLCGHAWGWSDWVPI